jgi:predicted metal-binding protein
MEAIKKPYLLRTGKIYHANLQTFAFIIAGKCPGYLVNSFVEKLVC